MALVNPVPASVTSLGALSADTVFTCRKGMVAISTDGGTGDDVYDLAAGDRLVIASGNTVTYFARTASDVLHHMAL